MNPPRHDVVIIGGGIVGMATAMSLVWDTRLSVAVLEAEDRVAAHQSGHNTGVIHSGIYNRPGTLKARLCVEGREALYRYCEEHRIAHERCGKVVVAARERDLAGLHELEERAHANGLLGVRRLDPAGIREHEPRATGIAGLFVPEAGIVDYAEVTKSFAGTAHAGGGEIRTGARLLRCRREEGGFVLETTGGEFRCRFVVNCAGLQSDRVARTCGADPGVQVVPFRGQFYELLPERRSLVRNLIYPVPDLNLPFLGVHITRTIHGQVEGDPNGALTFRREGYGLRSFSPADMAEMLSYRGFWLMAARHLKTGIVEALRAYSKRAFVAPLRRMIPDLRPEDFRPSRAGVHAQAVRRDGRLDDDVRLVEAGRTIHVLNATSPAATASIAFGRLIAERIAQRLDLKATV